MRNRPRSARSYLAGLGTSGSLVAGAALLFVLASAIVAFRGWPQVATGPVTTAVPAAARPAAPSRTGRRLAAVLRRDAVRGSAAARATGLRGTAKRSGHSGGSTGTGASGSTPAVGGAPTVASGASGISSTSPRACNGTSCAGQPSLVTHLANTVAQQVSGIGSKVGSQVSSTTGRAGGGVGGVSPQAGNTVQSTGSAVGSAVSGTTSTAGNTVNQVGNALGGGH